MPDATTRAALETVADLRRRGLLSDTCPNSYESGCRCPDHTPGLAEYAQDQDAYLIALHVLTKETPPARLSAVPDQPTGCTQGCGMIARCDYCKAQNAQRQALGEGPAALKPRPARLRHAA